MRPSIQILAPGEGKSARIGAHRLLYKAASSEGAGYSFAELILQPGKGAERHSHPRTESLYVLTGNLEVIGEDGVPHRVGAGYVVHMPAGAIHGFFNCGDELARVISIGSSAQQTFFEDVAAALATATPGSRAALDAAYAKHAVTWYEESTSDP